MSQTGEPPVPEGGGGESGEWDWFGGAGQAQSDEDLKLLALNGLIGSDPSKAIPALQKILMSNNSTRVKDRALFVLAQSDSPEAQRLLTDTAKTPSAPGPGPTGCS